VPHRLGGDHSQGEFHKIRSGVHRYVTDKDLLEIIRVLARIEPDERIASILNRNQRRTAHGEVWTAKRVYYLRNRNRIPVYCERKRQARSEMFVEKVGKVLGVTQTTVLRLIRLKQLPATQACAGAPWVMGRADVERCMAERNRTATPATADECTVASSRIRSVCITILFHNSLTLNC
jgi:hypothetical protein